MAGPRIEKGFMKTTLYRTVRLGDTDAAGLIYTPQYFRMAQDLLEEALEQADLPLRAFLPGGSYPLLPTVHAEGDFTCPLRIGDRLRAEIEIQPGESKSVVCRVELFTLNDESAAVIRTIHVAMAPDTGESMELPAPLRARLEQNHGH